MRYAIFVTLLIVVVVFLAAFACEVADTSRVETDNHVPLPSMTEGHHGGELAAEAYQRGDSSFLQHGPPDAERDDYLIVCDESKNGRDAVGHVYNRGTGFHSLRDSYGTSGCRGRDYPFNAESHNINDSGYSIHD